MLTSRMPIIRKLPRDVESIEILISSDVHCGSAEFNERKWNAFEQELMKSNKYVAFVGDQCEYATRSSKSDVYTQTLRPSEQKRWWIDHLRPYSDKIICIIDGNHEFNRASKDADDFPLYDIALAVGVEDVYRSEAAFVDISLGWDAHANGQPNYAGRFTHRAQNLVNYGTADSIEGIDFFVSGHTHKPQDKPLGKLIYDCHNKCIREKTVENIVGGHFLNYGGYGERGGYRPASQKMYSIILSGKKKGIETRGFHL